MEHTAYLQRKSFLFSVFNNLSVSCQASACWKVDMTEIHENKMMDVGDKVMRSEVRNRTEWDSIVIFFKNLKIFLICNLLSLKATNLCQKHKNLKRLLPSKLFKSSLFTKNIKLFYFYLEWN